MGTSRNSADLVRKLNDAGKALTSNRPAIEAAAFASKQVFQASLAASGVSGSTRISRAVKARYDVKGQQHATAIVRYTGPAHLLNNPTSPHEITPRKGRRRKARVLRFDGQFAMSAQHPGTAGLKFFEKARVIVMATAPKIYRRAGVTIPLRRVFK